MEEGGTIHQSTTCSQACPTFENLDGETEDPDGGETEDPDGGEMMLMGDVLAIGDSILAFHSDEGRSIPDYIAQETGLTVTNESVGGSFMLGDSRTIPSQYVTGDWSWVVIDGGGNDINDGCWCNDPCATDSINAILSPDGTSGVLVSLVDRITTDGAQIVLLDYYDFPVGGLNSPTCQTYFSILTERYTAFASTRDNVLFIDMGDAVDYRTNPEYLAEDQLHPSPAASEAVGRLIGQRMLAR
ncbi:MAG: SGNH/GDSL hydrolase family protein [Myxococcota bacterium]